MKIILPIVTALLLMINAEAQPDQLAGSIRFTSQAQIDAFQSTFPGPVMIGGDVTISGPDITNLLGLAVITSLDGGLIINDNPSLASLAGLDNIIDSSIIMITISQNPLLSHCAAKSICDYLAMPDASVLLYGNAAGCNCISQIQHACNTAIKDNEEDHDLSISPNPVSGRSKFTFTTHRFSRVRLEIISSMGCIVKVITDEPFPSGEHTVQWNATELQAGMYYYRFSTGSRCLTGKIVVNASPLR
jgi:hypothetical protein